MRGLFVTGTDTGVGKTVVTATLTRILRSRGLDAVAMKPFATGISPEASWHDNDPALLSAAMDNAESAEAISPVRLPAALSPYDAARLSGATLDVDAITTAMDFVISRHEFVIIEGVGGVAVPLTEQLDVADFAHKLNYPAVVVARSQIGTVNHTLLTVGALRRAHVSLEGLVFSRAGRGELALDEKFGTETACRLGRISCFGQVERSAELEIAGTLEEAVAALPVNDPALVSLADHILAQVKSASD